MASETATPATADVLTTVDGRPLKAALAEAQRTRRIRAVLLVTPLLLFIFATFLFPIALMMFRSVDNPLIAQNLPKTIAVLEKSWNGKDVPGEEAFAALREDLMASRAAGQVGKVATRLNFETSGMRSAVTRTARKAKKMKAPYKDQILKVHDAWSKREVWATIKR